MYYAEQIDSYTLPSKPIAEPSRGGEREFIMMQATAYDLSIQCCGKPIGHPARGITKGGCDLNGKTGAEVHIVSSNDFPIGTRLKLLFPENHAQYNGIYTVEDTGNMEHGVLDIYMGDFGEKVGRETVDFGRVAVQVEILN
jgi:3D (Asp-Asp-Asp) domain-containing protein